MPEEIHDDGTLKPTSIEKKELKRQLQNSPPERGCSVNREAFAELETLQSKAAGRQARAPEMRKEVWGFRSSVAQIREITHEGRRALCVVDRAENDDASHAEIWGAEPGRGDAALKKIRFDLASTMKKAVRIV